MRWRIRPRAWLFPRHSARWNDRPLTDMLYGCQSWVAWDQLRLFIAETNVDDVLGDANPQGDDWWKLAVCVHGLKSVLLGQKWPNSFRCLNFTREVTGGWPVLERTSWLVTCAWIWCAGYITSTTGPRHQDVIWTLQSYSHVSAPWRSTGSIYALYRWSLDDNEIDVRQISRFGAFMHMLTSSIRLWICISLSPPGTIYDPRYINESTTSTWWPRTGTIDGAPWSDSGVCILVLFQFLILSPSWKDSSCMISKARIITSSISAKMETLSAKSRSVNTSWSTVIPRKPQCEVRPSIQSIGLETCRGPLRILRESECL